MCIDRKSETAPCADLKLQIAMYSVKGRYMENTDGPQTDAFSGIGLGQFQFTLKARDRCISNRLIPIRTLR